MHLTYLCRMLETRDVQRFMLRAGIHIGTEAAIDRVKLAFAEFVFQVQNLALVNMETNSRLTVHAEDIRVALAAHSSRIRLYGFDDIDEGEAIETNEEDEDIDDDELSDNASDADTSECDESDMDDKLDQDTLEDIFDDGEFGEGEFSGTEEAGDTAHAKSYEEEDAHWTSNDGFVRIEEVDMQAAVNSLGTNPYIVSRHILLQMWTALSTLPITRSALSALHNATEHYVLRELKDGALGSQFLYCVMEKLLVQQADENDRLENLLAQRVERTPKKRGLREIRPELDENVPPSPLVASTAVELKKSIHLTPKRSKVSLK
ncbi:hypothetical protein LEN26_007907 [Aphanomyces euteiches]|nr:hypothetical protein AeMF1_002714 [Aphanomyces euteiches]KAH9131103.1 hypothetical protein LEN26_007907 [Aphanomyces euteiches]KAH9195762.1 hypothetical protein AeNC1_002268 [Aphanomyces euteiches]